MTLLHDQPKTARELEWLETIPAHWKIDRLKWSISGIFNGVWGDEPNSLEDIVCIRVADFDRTRFKVAEDSLTLRAVAAKDRMNRILLKGDLLIEKSGGGENQPVGCVVHFDHDYSAVCSNFIGRMPVATDMYPRFWSYVHAFLYAERMNVLAIKQTTGIQNLDADSYFNLKVPFPPFVEQRAIAEYLDRETAKIDALVAAKERLLETLAEKRKALITNAVTRGLDAKALFRDSNIPWLGKIPAHWDIWKTGHFSQVGNGSTPSRENSEYWSNGTIPWLNSAVVNRDEVTDAEQFVTDIAFRECHLPMVSTGSVLVGITGQGKTRGLSVVLSCEATINQHIAFITPDKERADSWYLRWLLFSAYNYLRAISDDTGGTKGALTCEELAGLRVPLPPLSEQRAIVTYIATETAKLDALKTAAERTIALLKERRAALISTAVTGKINCLSAIAEGN
ncbi:MAG: restriction endonuclease subunit S [Nitrospiraceae bacterium]|nr:MAG: restriction endonuclease subunit S [Nitrospiraceae bacterium]